MPTAARARRAAEQREARTPIEPPAATGEGALLLWHERLRRRGDFPPWGDMGQTARRELVEVIDECILAMAARTKKSEPRADDAMTVDRWLTFARILAGALESSFGRTCTTRDRERMGVALQAVAEKLGAVRHPELARG